MESYDTQRERIDIEKITEHLLAREQNGAARIRICCRVAEAYHSAGREKESMQWLQRAQHMYEGCDIDTERASAICELALTHMQCKNTGYGIPLLKQLEQESMYVDTEEHEEYREKLLQNFIQTLITLKKTEWALRVLSREFAQNIEGRPTLFELYLDLAVASAWKPETAHVTLECLQGAQVIIEKIKSTDERDRLLGRYATACARAGRFSEVLHMLQNGSIRTEQRSAILYTLIETYTAHDMVDIASNTLNTHSAEMQNIDVLKSISALCMFAATTGEHESYMTIREEMRGMANLLSREERRNVYPLLLHVYRLAGDTHHLETAYVDYVNLNAGPKENREARSRVLKEITLYKITKNRYSEVSKSISLDTITKEDALEILCELIRHMPRPQRLQATERPTGTTLH